MGAERGLPRVQTIVHAHMAQVPPHWHAVRFQDKRSFFNLMRGNDGAFRSYSVAE